MEFPPLKQETPISSLQSSIFLLWHNCVHLSNPEDDDEINNISNQLHGILNNIKMKLINPPSETIQEVIYMSILNNMLCFLAYTRDIHMGLGYRKLTYSMITVWYEYFPQFTKDVIQLLVQQNNGSFSYGSWRDIPELCNYIKHYTLLGLDHPLINFLVSFMNENLHSDWQHYKQNNTCKTNVAKWIPRESSKKNNWLFRLLFLDWSKKHTHYLKHNSHDSSYVSSLLKCKTKYRKMVSNLTQSIMPLERILSSKTNETTFPSNISNKALVKYWDTLFNQNNHFQEKHVNSVKHNVCANNLSYYIKNLDNISFFRPNLPSTKQLFFPEHIDKYVKLAYRCVQHLGHYCHHIPDCPRLTEEISVLNSKWNHMHKKWDKRGFITENTIPIIDINVFSLDDPVLHGAIARACFIAQSSNIKRILFSAHVPIWINVQDATNFVHMVQIIYHALQNEILINTNLDFSLELLGENNLFVPLVVSQNGYCYEYKREYSFHDFFSIMDSPRYKLVQNLLV